MEASRRFPDSLKTFHYNDGQPIARGQFAVYLLPSLEGRSLLNTRVSKLCTEHEVLFLIVASRIILR